MGVHLSCWKNNAIRVVVIFAFALIFFAGWKAASALSCSENPAQEGLYAPSRTATAPAVSAFMSGTSTPAWTVPPAVMFAPESPTPAPTRRADTPAIGMFVPPAQTQLPALPAPSPASSDDLSLAVGSILLVGVGVAVYAMTQAIKRVRRLSSVGESPAVLMGSNGYFAGRRFIAKNGMLIGRSRACAVMLNDSSVSRVHARLILEGGQWCIEDMNSRSGVYVNGILVRKGVLSRGARIRIGVAEFQFN